MVSSVEESKYSGLTKVVLPIVRIIVKGVLRTIAASWGWLTYWLALDIAMGRVVRVEPPRIATMAIGNVSRKKRVCVM